MRQEWISARVDKYYAESGDWGDAARKAYADAAAEWPLYRKPDYSEKMFDLDPIYRAQDGAWRA